MLPLSPRLLAHAELLNRDQMLVRDLIVIRDAQGQLATITSGFVL